MIINNDQIKSLNKKNKIRDELIYNCYSDGNNTIEIHHLKNYKDYKNYVTEQRSFFSARLRLEEFIASNNKREFQYSGLEPFSSTESNFRATKKKNRKRNNIQLPNFRESLISNRNGLNSRLRATLYALNSITDINQLDNKSVYLTESTTHFYKYFEKNVKTQTLIGSEFLGAHLKSGEIVEGVRHEDLTQTSFKNNELDLIISLEVLEHIPDYKESLSELYRITKQDGNVLISVPFSLNKQEHTERAKLNPDGSIHHILPPEYHGDPVNSDGGILCFRYYGWELIEELKKQGFKEVGLVFVWSHLYAIIGGNEIGLIYARK